MRFLALTAGQAALLALFTAGTIIGLYFLKLRYRRVSVPSSLLWQRVLDEKVTNSLREKMRKIISIAVAVIIGLLIALSIARPEIESLTGRAHRIVIVLDTSPSMNARTNDGATRWQHAVDRARALVDSGGPTAEVLIADTTGQASSPYTADHGEALKLIDQLAPQDSAPRFPKVDGRDSTVYFISDGVGIRDIPAFAERVSVYQPASNVGITAFEIRRVPSNPLEYEAYLEVHNYSSAEDVALTVNGGDKDSIARTLHLGANENFRETFDLSNFQGGAVRANIQAKGDALPDDDAAYAYLPIKRKTRTLLVTTGNNYLATLLKVNPYVALETTTPANYREQPEIDAYIFDRFAPQTAPAKPALIIGAPAAPWLRATQGQVQKPEITTWSDNHPIMQYVSVHDVSIEHAARIDAQNLTVVAASNQIPLIVASENPRWVMLTFDLNSSDFPLQAGFPVFIDNVLAWFNREQLAIHHQAGFVDVALANAKVVTTDGKAIPSEQQLGKTVFHAAAPGIYIASQGDARVPVAVSLSNPLLSNINDSVLKDGTSAIEPGSWFRHELWFYMLIGALILISAEWFTYHRRITL